MSWYRQVKTIYTATYLVFIFICYSLAAGILLKEKLDFKVYIFLLGSALIMQHLKVKEKSRILAVGVPSIIIAALYFIIFPLEAFLIHTVFNTVIIAFLEKRDEEDVNYDAYKDRMRQAIFILLPLGLIAQTIRTSNVYRIYTFFMLFLIFTVITLREARNYTNKIRNKKGTAANFSIVAVGIIACTDFASTGLMKLLYYIYMPISFVIGKLADILFRIFGVPLIMLLQKGMEFLAKHKVTDQQQNEVKLAEELQQKYPSEGNSIVPKIVAALLLIFIVIQIIKFYKKLRVHHMKRTGDTNEIEKEKILYIENKKKKSAIVNLINKLFRKDGTVREQIIYIYSRFQFRMKLREIFKPYMTATQLSNVAKIDIDQYDALESLKCIYNEAKFSKHNIPRENAEKMKMQYSKIKKS